MISSLHSAGPTRNFQSAFSLRITAWAFLPFLSDSRRPPCREQSRPSPGPCGGFGACGPRGDSVPTVGQTTGHPSQQPVTQLQCLPVQVPTCLRRAQKAPPELGCVVVVRGGWGHCQTPPSGRAGHQAPVPSSLPGGPVRNQPKAEGTDGRAPPPRPRSLRAPAQSPREAHGSAPHPPCKDRAAK